MSSEHPRSVDACWMQLRIRARDAHVGDADRLVGLAIGDLRALAGGIAMTFETEALFGEIVRAFEALAVTLRQAANHRAADGARARVHALLDALHPLLVDGARDRERADCSRPAGGERRHLDRRAAGDEATKITRVCWSPSGQNKGPVVEIAIGNYQAGGAGLSAPERLRQNHRGVPRGRRN